MTWLWKIEDFDFRLAFARENGPTDFLTKIVHFILRRIAIFLTYALAPLDSIGKIIGRGLTAMVIGMAILLLLTAIWFPIWCLLMGTSRLWLRYSWTRPLLLLPGLVIAIFSYAYIMAMPDADKVHYYVDMIAEWPLSHIIYAPPETYVSPVP